MTEKRFEIRLCSNGDKYLYYNGDLFIGKDGDYIATGMIGADKQFVELLNEQYEEIEQLQKQLSHLEYRFFEYRNKLKSLPKDEVNKTLQKHYDKSKEYNHIDTERYYIGMGVIKEIAKELGVELK